MDIWQWWGAGILPTTVTIFCMKTNMDILQNEYRITIFLRKERRLKSISGSQRGHSGLFPPGFPEVCINSFPLGCLTDILITACPEPSSWQFSPNELFLSSSLMTLMATPFFQLLRPKTLVPALLQLLSSHILSASFVIQNSTHFHHLGWSHYHIAPGFLK